MSYDEGINLIFDYCVELLIIAAQSIGMTYEEINVWFFYRIRANRLCYCRSLRMVPEISKRLLEEAA